VRPPTLLREFFGRLEVSVRRVGTVLLPEAPTDGNGRYHPALRSGQSARSSFRVDNRWETLRRLLSPPETRGGGHVEVSGISIAPTDAGGPLEKTAASGRNAAA
jgi:hypothetical protein